MRNLSRNDYSTEEIMDALKGASGSRVVKFRYDVLDENEKKIDELYEVTDGEVTMSAFSTIKRTATFSLREETKIVQETQSLKVAELPSTLKEWK